MKLTKCESGHFFDGDKFPACPYCNTELQQGGGIVTASPAADTPAAAAVPAVATGPVVGWLVAMTGANAGQDYRLEAGRRFFGVDAAGAPCALAPASPLEQRLLIVAYDAKSGSYSALPGAGQELAYVNGAPNLTPVTLHPGDTIILGDAELRFLPLCGAFKWEDAMPKAAAKPAEKADAPKLPDQSEPPEQPEQPEAAAPAADPGRDKTDKPGKNGKQKYIAKAERAKAEHPAAQ